MHSDLIRFVLFVVAIAWAVGAFRSLGRRMAAPPEPPPQEPQVQAARARERAPEPARQPLTLRVLAQEAAAPPRSAPEVRRAPPPAPPSLVPPPPELVVVEQVEVAPRRRRPRSTLRRAVVWAEILSRPVALRDAGTLGRPPAF